MALTHVLLFFHLLGAFCFFAGGAVVGVLQLAAIRQEKPSQIYAFLRLAPFGAALVGAGALLTLGFGIGLAEHEGLRFSPAWIRAALGLWVAAMVLGAYGGRTARHARHLAKSLAAEGDEPSPELRALVGARGPLYASFASVLLLVAIVVLMVWQPSSPAQSALPAVLVQKLASGDPRIAFSPAGVPAGYSPARNAWSYGGSSYLVDFYKPGTPRSYVLKFFFEAGCWHHLGKPQARLEFNHQVLSLYRFGQSREVWVCRYGAWRAVTASDPRIPTVDLERMVAEAEPIR